MSPSVTSCGLVINVCLGHCTQDFTLMDSGVENTHLFGLTRQDQGRDERGSQRKCTTRWLHFAKCVLSVLSFSWLVRVDLFEIWTTIPRIPFMVYSPLRVQPEAPFSTPCREKHEPAQQFNTKILLSRVRHLSLLAVTHLPKHLLTPPVHTGTLRVLRNVPFFASMKCGATEKAQDLCPSN